MQKDDVNNNCLAVITEHCRDLLDVDEVAPEALFLELGGNSLLATMLANRLEEDLGIRPCIDEVLVSTIGELAELCITGQHCAQDGLRLGQDTICPP